MAPTISDLKTFPEAPANKFTDSMTSKNTSFLRYLTPSVLQDTALVTAEIKIICLLMNSLPDYSRTVSKSIANKNKKFPQGNYMAFEQFMFSLLASDGFDKGSQFLK